MVYTDEEIDAIWTRIKSYIDFSEITELDSTNQRQQLITAMENVKNGDRHPMASLANSDFSSGAIDNPKIKMELSNQAKGAYIKERERTFEIENIEGKEMTRSGHKYLVFRGFKKDGSGKNVFAGMKRIS